MKKVLAITMSLAAMEMCIRDSIKIKSNYKEEKS